MGSLRREDRGSVTLWWRGFQISSGGEGDMTANLTLNDILFMFDQVTAGDTPLPGADPLAPIGIRTIDGTYNNISGLTLLDQFGNLVDTSTFGNVNGSFINWSNSTSSLAYAPFGTVTTDGSERIISNLIADATATNPATVGAQMLAEGDIAVDRLPENSLFTIFGQFFDHGLDFISKKDNGVILIPVDPVDMPGVDPAFPFIPVTRAEVDPITGETVNTTAPFVEQSQTYGSSAATTFYLMEYDPATGLPTGDLIRGSDGGMGTWADVKENANNWARAQPGAALDVVMLTDAHIHDIPDPGLWDSALGQFVPDPVTGKIGTGQAFLADIAHFAVPEFDPVTGDLAPDADTVINPHGIGAVDPEPATYDNELLDAHYVSGDPRANENAALTAVHQAFHGEHHRIVEQIRDWVQQQNQIDPTFAAQWTGEMYFQAAKIANEMQYQHLVFEEFGRRMSPNIDAFSAYDININPNITAEFSQAVYRLGHSQLTDNVKTMNSSGNEADLQLVDAFLDPEMFARFGGGDFLKGGQFEQGARIDEFMVDALRNFLVGLPLDLAAINIARGRELGLPSLNQLRADLFSQTGGEASLAPYLSWEDFGANLLNPESLMNFVAAYGKDAGGTLDAARATGDADAMRAAAQNLMANSAFMSGAAASTGVDDIDLWMGGLAEQKVPLGLLGSTFDFIFAQQMIALQNGDRFYYLDRIGGNLLDQIEGQTLSDIMMRSGDAVHLHGDAFGTPDLLIELGVFAATDHLKSPSELNQYVSEIIAGTHGNNTIQSGAGNDMVYGEGGDDTLFGGANDDHVYGGTGNDVIWGEVGFDLLRGDAGNDELHGGADDDAIFGNVGDDVLFGDAGFDALAGGPGNDEMHGGSQDDELLGGEGDDRIFGDAGDDLLDGEEGNDVLFGGFGIDQMFGGPGDDMLFGGAGGDQLDGGVGGYDIANYEDWLASAKFGGGLTINMIDPALSTGDARGDTFRDIEEVRGTIWNDIIIADNIGHVLNGNAGNDTLTGGLLDDTFIGGDGNDRLIGTGGVNTAVYLGAEANFSITPGLGGTVIVTDTVGTQGIDTLSGIQWLVFDDAMLDTNTLQYAPLVGVSGTHERVQNGTTVIGELEADVNLVDGTPVPGTGITIGTVEIADPDGALNGARTIALAGVDATSFDVVNNGGNIDLVFIGAGGGSFVNYEAKPVYHVTVTATDALGGSAVNVTVNVDDINDNAPTVTSARRVNVSEGAGPSSIIYYANATDLDSTGEAIVFSLSGADAASFNLTPEGELTFVSAPLAGLASDANGDNIYDVSITASDGINTSEVRNVAIHLDAVFNSIVGTVGNDTLVGTAGQDHILGLEGNDNINGQSGDDWVQGGPGDDTLSGSNFNDRLEGEDGNDFLTGGNGADHLDGGPGTDTASWKFSSTGVNINLLAATAFGGSAEGDTFVSIENVQGSAHNDTITGDDAANRVYARSGDDEISGGLGSDRLYGDSGDDTLYGGADVDILTGGAGADSIDGGDGLDLASYISSLAAVTVDLSAGTGIGGDAQGDVLVAIEQLQGSNLGDSLTGDDTANRIYGEDGADVLSGLGGIDVMYGGAGDDTLLGGTETDVLSGGVGADSIDGGDGTDIAFFGRSAAGVTVDLLAGVGLAGDALGDVYVSIEDVAGSDFADNITGNADANRLTGGLGDDVLDGGGGEDKIYGGEGADILKGGTLNDLLSGDAGADSLDGGDGIDLAFYAASDAAVQVDLGTGLGTGGHAQGDILVSIEDVAGSNFGDIIIGNGDGNRLRGASGDDSINGADGADVIYGDAGSDTINGGLGDDWFVGGADADTFEFDAAWGSDIVSDYEDGIDIIDMRGSGLLYADLTIAQSGAHVLVYETLGTNSIRLDNTIEADIDEFDFIFV